MNQTMPVLGELGIGLASDIPPASVVILTRNRAKSLTIALAAVRAQDYPSYEVIVVDNGSSDITPQVIAAYGACRVYVPSRYGIGYCRNRGVREAKGEVIAFLDDDCVPVRGWLSALVQKMLADPQIGLLGGTVINVGFEGAKTNKGRTRLGSNGTLSFTADPEQAEFFGNANLALRRAAVDVVGNYDPFFNTMEEIDISTRMRKHGYRVTYMAAAVVEHHHRGALFKNRHLFYGPQLARLYFFMKHFRPQTAQAWATFLRYELHLLSQDLIRSFRLAAWVIVKRRWDRVGAAGVELFNTISARLAIPWLIWRATERFRPPSA